MRVYIYTHVCGTSPISGRDPPTSAAEKKEKKPRDLRPNANDMRKKNGEKKFHELNPARSPAYIQYYIPIRAAHYTIIIIMVTIKIIIITMIIINPLGSTGNLPFMRIKRRRKGKIADAVRK